MDKKRKEMEKFYGEKGEIAWGRQIRSYVLQPYTMVKDHRTDVETGNAQAVLDGDLDLFIEAYLKQNRKRVMNILEEIVADKREEVAAVKKRPADAACFSPAAELRGRRACFVGALRSAADRPDRRGQAPSPSAGAIREPFDPAGDRGGLRERPARRPSPC